MNPAYFLVGALVAAYLFLYIYGRFYLIRENFSDMYYDTTLSTFETKHIKRIERA